MFFKKTCRSEDFILNIPSQPAPLKSGFSQDEHQVIPCDILIISSCILISLFGLAYNINYKPTQLKYNSNPFCSYTNENDIINEILCESSNNNSTLENEPNIVFKYTNMFCLVFLCLLLACCLKNKIGNTASMKSKPF